MYMIFSDQLLDITSGSLFIKAMLPETYLLPIMICFCLYLCRMFWGNKCFHSFIHNMQKGLAWFYKHSLNSVCNLLYRVPIISALCGSYKLR